jgi:hypothetical protein
MKELLNIPKTFQIHPPNKPGPFTVCLGKPSTPTDELRNSSSTWTKGLKPLKTKQKMSMDELWQSVPSRKTSNWDSGKSTKPYSRSTQITREKPRLSQRLGLPPQPSQKRRSLAERLGVPPLSTPWDPTPPAGSPPLIEKDSVSMPPPSLLQRLQPPSLLQRLKSPN